ncbi:Gfo/Idh/MocA family oxidoreductase [Fulvivirga sp. M361]|uniref:Gfo/Idh/MocA family protein n=1 Tax=Fulvivirga sp. M361 TaxID=2594266 RepID=UPI00117BCC6C|nr:Gfo/Idh/MocA family oxidoreductase [Fulvivirga sp. M361]TRX58438.1 Gfo/Idh/MocA family oxidoreductase [Fulvivirga sp. M361]
MKRREFVKSATAAGTGVLAAGSVLGNSLVTNADQPLKIALIGCGGRGTGATLTALNYEIPCELVAMADLFPEPIERSFTALNSRIEDPKKIKVTEETKFLGFQGYKKAIALCDVAFIGTPAVYKPVIFEEAIRQGKHVFMEKPVCVDAFGYKKVLEAAAIAKTNRLYVAGGLQRRYGKEYQAVIDYLHDGIIGNITSAECYWFGGPIGDLSRPRKDEWTEMEFQNRHWRSFAWVGGGNIIEYHIHNLDVINWALKQEHPQTVLASGGKVAEKLYSGSLGGFDTVSSHFMYENNVPVYSFSRNLPNCSNKHGEIFFGTKGRFEIKGNNAIAYNHKGKVMLDLQKKMEDLNPFHNAHPEVQKTLLKAIADNDNYINDAFYAAHSSMTGIFGRMSAWSGKRLNWEDAVQSEIKLFDYTDETNFNSAPPILPDKSEYYPVPIPGKTKV